MKLYTVAILGATGAVGQEMIKILQERNFPAGKLIPLASKRSAGKKMPQAAHWCRSSNNGMPFGDGSMKKTPRSSFWHM